MASKPSTPELPTPVAPPPVPEIKIGKEDDISLNKKVKGLNQLQIKPKSTTTNIGLNY
jgi:hypothetical protein